VLLEANLAETPAIAANLEGIRDVITDGENGFKIEVLDHQTFAAKIDEVLAADIDAFGKKSREFVLEKFNWNKVARDYISYLQFVSSTKG
jgi:phosphatidylinositol alpha-1,6-mannosyltransferase